MLYGSRKLEGSHGGGSDVESHPLLAWGSASSLFCGNGAKDWTCWTIDGDGHVKLSDR